MPDLHSWVPWLLYGVFVGAAAWVLYKVAIPPQRPEGECSCGHNADDHPPVTLGSELKHRDDPVVVFPCMICRCADFRRLRPKPQFPTWMGD